MEEYNNIITIDPKYWGKCGWIFLNSIGLTYDEKLKDKYKQFIQSLPYVLPCKKCGSHLKNNIDNIDDILKNKETFLNWLLYIRNNICKEQQKEVKTIKNNLEEIFFDNFNNLNNINNSEDNNQINYFIIILVVLLIFYFIYYITKNKNITT